MTTTINFLLQLFAADIAYVQHKILHDEAIFTLMIASFFLNLAVPVTIAWWRPHCVTLRDEGTRTTIPLVAPNCD